MQKNKNKNLNLFLFSHLSFNDLSNLTLKDWVYSHKVKQIISLLSNKNCIRCSQPFPCPSESSLSQEFYRRFLFETILISLKMFNTHKNFCRARIIY